MSAGASAPPPEPGCDGFASAEAAANQRRYRNWTLVAALAYIGAAAGLRWRANLPDWLPWLLVALAALLFLQATRSYLVFLRCADELLRKIETEALAAGFGAGILLALLAPLAHRLGAPELDAGALALVMVLVWGAASQLGRRRYRGSDGG